MEKEPEEFSSWGGVGGVAGIAALVTAQARQAGYPDVPQLVARTVALLNDYQPFGDDSPDRRADLLVNDAAALALTDPLTARHLLAVVAPPGVYEKLALDKSRDWLFALALADPERAMALADAKMERAKFDKSPRGGLSFSGLVELTGILSTKDRLNELTRWASLHRAVDEE